MLHFLLDFLFDKDENFIMSVAFKKPKVGTNAENIAKLDARLLAMFQALEVHEDVMARLGEIGVVTVNALHTLVDDRKERLDLGKV